MSFKLKDIISVNDFSQQDINFVLSQAERMLKLSRKEKALILENQVVASLFFEPSTRTRLSFETAIQNLGGRIIGFNDPKISSTVKGETLSDAIRMVEKYADLIVLRHPLNGSARRAAEISSVPVINAGDGSNQHPTQMLLDLFTIKKEFDRLEGLTIGLLGDLKFGRTVHSLLEAITKFPNNTVYCISPEELKMPETIKNKVKGKLKLIETTYLNECLPELDVLYVTRVQKERFPDLRDYERVKNLYIIDKRILIKAKESLKVMHPLPRVNEINPEVDSTIHALYFQQAANGVPVREALLELMSKAVKKRGEKNE
ncbi:MAG: aspartate carbamoyltransferase [archaeon]